MSLNTAGSMMCLRDQVLSMGVTPSATCRRCPGRDSESQALQLPASRGHSASVYGERACTDRRVRGFLIILLLLLIDVVTLGKLTLGLCLCLKDLR